MSASYLVNSINNATYPVGGIRTAESILDISEGGDADQHFGFQHQHTTQGGWFDTVGGGGTPSGLTAYRHYTNISSFRPGRTYAQFALVRSNLSPFLAYVKTTAGTQPLTTDPSLDAVNWAANTTVGPSLVNNVEILDYAVFIQGNQPSQVQFLNDAPGPAVTIVGRSADGTTNPRAQLGVAGTISCAGLSINNTGRPVGGEVTGTVTLVNGVGTIPSTAIAAGSTVLVQRTLAGGAAPGSYTVSVVPGTATVTSTNVAPAGDNSTLTWFIINPVI